MVSRTEHIRSTFTLGIQGRVTRLIGTTAAVSGFPVPLGAGCLIARDHGAPLTGEVIGFSGRETLIAACGDWAGIRRGDGVHLTETRPSVRVGPGLLGRVLNGLGEPIDGRPAPRLPHQVPLTPDPISPLQRPRIETPFQTGIRVVDTLFTCGQGQRLGIMAGSGVGKSTLLGQLARFSHADLNVIVLVGERGREVREFLEQDLGPAGLARSIVVVATSDEAAILRRRAALLGTSIAEYFRDSGRHVLLLMDSVTRCALAQRELGLAAGEPPATRGFPPSVFAFLPRLLERSGRTERGSITAFYSVLVEGDDHQEPVTDTVRGILDGHLVLSRQKAEQGCWPAIDPLASLSRLVNQLNSADQLRAIGQLRQVLAAERQSSDLVQLGAYVPGSQPLVDQAIRWRAEIDRFLQQDRHHGVAASESWEHLQQLLRRLQSEGVA